jgi:hypothetical protein
MNDKKKMKQLVAAIERGEGDEKKSFWTRIGVAFENRDGSWNLRFDYLPANMNGTTVQLRDFEPKNDDGADEGPPGRRAEDPPARRSSRDR